ncbi:hypothetical protein DYB32_007504 [Aphanomyces invadans]|nr:hypothetical protein DYB32_007504 [Aphanomyces invadans]
MLVVSRQWTEFRAAAFERRALVIYTFSGVLMGVSLYLGVWSVVNGFIVEMSLGFFISPLVNVVLGVVFLRERLRLWQWISVVMAFAGVLVVAIAYGKFPWLALTLSSTFGLYGLIKKKAHLPSLHGITLELGIFFIPSLVYLVVEEARGEAIFLHSDWGLDLYILASSFVTVVPSIFYSSAAQLIPLTLLGILQYIAPSLQFLTGVIVYHEDFTLFKLIGFLCVWAGLITFTTESIYFQRRAKPQADAAPDLECNSKVSTQDVVDMNSCDPDDQVPYEPCQTSKA